jgi:hypothetical protein
MTATVSPTKLVPRDWYVITAEHAAKSTVRKRTHPHLIAAALVRVDDRREKRA